MTTGKKFLKILNHLIEYLALIGGLLVFVMSILTTVDIIGRGLIDKAIPGTYELVQYMMVFLIFFGVAYLEAENGNVRMELIIAHFPKRGRVAVSLISSLIGLIVFGIILYTNAIYFWESWIAKETMYGIKGGPLYLWKFGVPLGSFFMCVELIIGVVRSTKQLITGGT